MVALICTKESKRSDWSSSENAGLKNGIRTKKKGRWNNAKNNWLEK